jgi:hypothetical protein
MARRGHSFRKEKSEGEERDENKPIRLIVSETKIIA